MRRRILIAVLVFFLIGVVYVAWTLVGLPPVKYYLRYGLDPYCEPTGETYSRPMAAQVPRNRRGLDDPPAAPAAG